MSIKTFHVGATPRRTFKQMGRVFHELKLSPRLFGKHATLDWDTVPMVDFEIENYVYFLDHVESLGDLILGLAEISPFADDALDIAEQMDTIDFSTFKLALVQERISAQSGKSSSMPEIFSNILLPNRFMNAIILAQKAATSLGVTLYRFMEVEREKV